LAKITRTQRRFIVSIALAVTAAMMLPTTTDARGGGGGSFGGHGGGAHIGHRGTVRATGPSIRGPVAVRRSSFAASAHAASSRMSFAHRNASFGHSRATRSHFFTLGADGVWVDNFVYTPNILVVQQPATAQPQQSLRHASVVRTPSAARAGVLVVRGDTKSYVTFPGTKRG
jgi:hypothetical protein